MTMDSDEGDVEWRAKMGERGRVVEQCGARVISFRISWELGISICKAN